MKLPRIATEGETFALTYEVKNVGGSRFPGGALNVMRAQSGLCNINFV